MIRFVYRFILDSDSIGELHVFFLRDKMPLEGDKIHLEDEFAKGIFIPRGKYRHSTDGYLKVLRGNLKSQNWNIIEIDKGDPNIQKIYLETSNDQMV